MYAFYERSELFLSALLKRADAWLYSEPLSVSLWLPALPNEGEPRKNLPLTQGEVSRSDGDGIPPRAGRKKIFNLVSGGVLLRCLIHKDEVRKIITLLVKRQNSESIALSGAFRSLRLDQRACEAYPRVSLKCGGCSPALWHSVRLIPQKSVPDRIGSSDNNLLNLQFWSSTTNENNSNNAYNVNFSNGKVNKSN